MRGEKAGKRPRAVALGTCVDSVRMARTAVVQGIPSQINLTPDEKAARLRERQLLQKARRQEYHFSLVFAAAYVTTMMLGKQGLSCAVFGSLACKLYGSFRYPEVSL